MILGHDRELELWGWYEGGNAVNEAGAQVLSRVLAPFVGRRVLVSRWHDSLEPDWRAAIEVRADNASRRIVPEVEWQAGEAGTGRPSGEWHLHVELDDEGPRGFVSTLRGRFELRWQKDIGDDLRQEVFCKVEGLEAAVRVWKFMGGPAPEGTRRDDLLVSCVGPRGAACAFCKEVEGGELTYEMLQGVGASEGVVTLTARMWGP